MAVQLSQLSLAERGKQGEASSAEQERQNLFQCHETLPRHYSVVTITNDFRKNETDLYKFYYDFRMLFDNLHPKIRRADVISDIHGLFSCKDLLLAEGAGAPPYFRVTDASPWTLPGLPCKLPGVKWIFHNQIGVATLVCDYCEKIEAVVRPILQENLDRDEEVSSYIVLDYLFEKMTLDAFNYPKRPHNASVEIVKDKEMDVLVFEALLQKNCEKLPKHLIRLDVIANDQANKFSCRGLTLEIWRGEDSEVETIYNIHGGDQNAPKTVDSEDIRSVTMYIEPCEKVEKSTKAMLLQNLGQDLG